MKRLTLDNKIAYVTREKCMLTAGIRNVMPQKSRLMGLSPIEEAEWSISAGLDKECLEIKFISKEIVKASFHKALTTRKRKKPVPVISDSDSQGAEEEKQNPIANRKFQTGKEEILQFLSTCKAGSSTGLTRQAACSKTKYKLFKERKSLRSNLKKNLEKLTC